MAKQHSRVTRHLLFYLRGVWLPFTVSFFLLVAVAALTAAKAWIIQPVVDTFLGGRSALRDLTLLCLIVAVIFILQAALNWLYTVVARIASANVVRSLREDLFRHLIGLDLGYFVRRPSGDLVSRVVNDVAIFENAAVNGVQDLMRDSLTVTLLIAVLVAKDWRLALICLGIAGIVGWVLRAMSRRIQRLSRRVQEMVSSLNQRLTEMVGGIELILGFGLGAQWRKRFAAVTREHCLRQIRETRTSATTVLSVLLIVGLGVSGILFFTGRALLDGRITPGDFGTFLAAIYLMQAPALTISNSVSKLSRGMAAAGRAVELFADAAEVVEPQSPVPLAGRELDVRFADVSFRYRREESILEGLTFNIRPGELVAMVGDSGAGKSTVTKLLMRFYDPDQGVVLLGGVSLRDVARAEIYRNVGYVSQDIFLFDDTIEFNLRVGRPDAPDAELVEAIRMACVDELIGELPEGLRTHVGERGMQLSGGQRQRIAIARAILSQARILVLDEATSALDMDLEQRILQNLVDADHTRTLFAVTHRLSLAEVADRVLVLKDGRLVEQGTAKSLLAHNGEFARLKRAAQASLRRRHVSPLETTRSAEA